ncbi:MAG: AAA family ATPase [Desulfotomaculaceae bacterium]|nr:AAA family ATPase [Desulfotomaculaceae bacterium]
MKIGISGACCTGKTALTQALSKKLGLPLIEEQARVAAREFGFENPKVLKEQPELGRQFQWRCLELQITAEDSQPGGFISDRTVLDNAVYWMKWHSRGAKSEENMRFYRTVTDQVRKYDLIVYVPLEISLVANGFKTSNRAYREEMDFLLGLFLTSYVESFIMVAGDLDTRVKQVEKFLGTELRSLICHDRR